MTDPYGYSYSWSYLDNGWLKTQTLPASVTSTWTYNAWGNPVDLTTKTSTGGVLSEYGSVTYDGVGNTKSVIATVAGSSTYGGLTSYQYSTKDEVTQESSARNGGYTYAFSYDGAGNPTTFKGVTHGFNSSNQDTANTYDLEGNPTTYKGTSMTWDAEDRLTGIGSTWTAGYRGDSLRAWKNNAGTKTYFLYDGGTPVVELSSTGAVTAVNSFGAAGLLARKTSVGPSFYSFDLQGNVAQRLASTGAVQASFNFDAYGVGHVTTSADPFGFGAQGGYYTDLETGLQAMSFRYYDAGAGRWLNRDPAGYGGGINLYGYCGNGPVGALDPLGLCDTGRDGWNDAADFFAGAGDNMSFGGTAALRKLMGTDDVVNHCSGWYHGGELAGMVVQTFALEGLGSELEAAEEEMSLASKAQCFPAGTPVVMADGSEKPIEQVRPGDRVLSADPQTKRQSEQPVTRTFVHPADALVRVTTEDGRSVECTPTHPFWVEGKGFVAAKRLARSDLLVDADGEESRVASVTARAGRFTVYNFEVADTHTYFAGSGRWWVHNACYEYHHLLPQEFEAEFNRAGFDIDEWTVKLERDFHQNVVHGPRNGRGGCWNAQWRAFWAAHPDAGTWEIMDQLGRMSKSMNIAEEPIVNYPEWLQRLRLRR